MQDRTNFKIGIPQPDAKSLQQMAGIEKESKTKYIITAEANTGGIISPSGRIPIEANSNKLFIMTPDFGYDVDKVYVDGIPVVIDTNKTYTLSNVTSEKTITASFTKTYTIDGFVGSEGKITPPLPQNVKHGSNQQFTITPGPGYDIDVVKVDGNSLNPITGSNIYEVQNVIADRTITVSFIATHVIDGSVGSEGKITPPLPQNVKHGSNQQFTITPNPGYNIYEVKLDGNSLNPITSYSNIYEVQNVTSDKKIYVSFIKTHTITFSAEEGGSIEPEGDKGDKRYITVHDGSEKKFIIKHNKNYEIANIEVDGIPIGSRDDHTLKNINADRTIYVTFKKKEEKVGQ